MSLLPPEDIIRIQQNHNRALDAEQRKARIENMTVASTLEEAAGALRWVFEEGLHGFRGTDLQAQLQQNNFLRGIGWILIIVSASLLVVDALS